MSISFPNRSRSYDASGSRVRFWGHDGPMEISFFVGDGALSSLDVRARQGEAGLLMVFDVYIDRILDVAARAYRGGRKQSFYVLAAEDFQKA